MICYLEQIMTSHAKVVGVIVKHKMQLIVENLCFKWYYDVLTMLNGLVIPVNVSSDRSVRYRISRIILQRVCHQLDC